MGWKSLNERKWELRSGKSVLATIYEKSSNRYSVYIAVPLIFRDVAPIIGKTYVFSSFEEAKLECDKMLKEKVLQWSLDLVSYVELFD